MTQDDCRALQRLLVLGSVTGLADEADTRPKSVSFWTESGKHTNDFSKDVAHLRYYVSISLLAQSPLSYSGIRLTNGCQRLDKARMNGLLTLGYVECDDAAQVFKVTGKGWKELGLG